MQTDISHLLAVLRPSDRGGGDVFVGGGSVSEKSDTMMWITDAVADFDGVSARGDSTVVAMNRSRLAAIARRSYPAEPLQREQEMRADLLAAREDVESVDVPSRDTRLHATLPHRVVLFTRPMAVTALACAVDGEAVTRSLFGPEALWLPATAAGRRDDQALRELLDRRRETDAGGADAADPSIVVMQNRGLLLGASSAAAVQDLLTRVERTVAAALRRRPALSPEAIDTNQLREAGEAVSRALADMSAIQGNALERPVVIGFDSPAVQNRAAAGEAPLIGPFTPDHLLAAGCRPCYVDLPPGTTSPRVLEAEVLHAVHDYAHDEEIAPRIVIIRGRGAVAVAPTEVEADRAHRYFRDALGIEAYAESFGGPRPLPVEIVADLRARPVL